MWVPLVVLAILATIGGFVGISTAFTGGKHVGGKMNIVTWLNPVIWNKETGQFGEPEEGNATPLLGNEGAFGANTSPAERERLLHAATERERLLHAGNSKEAEHGSFNLAHTVESAVHSETATEWVFIIISLVVAGFGIFLGFLFYIKSPQLADVWAARLAPLYKASYNKYWIDEFYGWAITRRTMDLARGVFAFDSKVVDGGVNGTAWLTRLTSQITGLTDKYFVDGLVNTIANFVVSLMSPIVRAAQTGLTANYALVMVIGLLVAVAWYFIKSS
jgi:NADH:ubiquinone oxidoreductase subunit 5 (subunit L)/multisubunit Na+/H+ antiporter MnhA subunit